MSKRIRRIVLVCAVVSALTACGKNGGTSLEDMQVSLVPDMAEGKPENAGQSENVVPDNSGQRENSASESGNQGNSDASDGSMQGTENVSGAQEQTDGRQESPARGTGSGETDPDRAAMIETYITILENIYFDQIFPDGQDYGYQPGNPYDVASNQFAVYDIDRDGKEELIIVYTTTYTAGQGAIIYGYDSGTGTVSEELRTYPLVTYYENGVVEELMSHNHGMAPDGDFWPYILYQYSDALDCYTEIASVDAWSRAYREEDYDGNPFPEDIDADGDGLVYYITAGEEEMLENPMDGAEYQNWRDSYIKGTKPVRIPYADLTPDQFYTLDEKASGISGSSGSGALQGDVCQLAGNHDGQWRGVDWGSVK